MADWALVTSTPNAVGRASESLQRLNFPHHVFWLRRTLVHRGRMIPNLVPAFSNYIFVRLLDCWEVLRLGENVLSYIGKLIKLGVPLVPNDVKGLPISGVICLDGDLAIVTDRAVDELIQRCEIGTNIIYIEEPAAFAHGDSVLIGGCGAFAGQRAVYERPLGNGRVCVDADLMGQIVSIDLDERDLDKYVSVSAAKKKRKRRRPSRHRRETSVLGSATV